MHPGDGGGASLWVKFQSMVAFSRIKIRATNNKFLAKEVYRGNSIHKSLDQSSSAITPACLADGRSRRTRIQMDGFEILGQQVQRLRRVNRRYEIKLDGLTHLQQSHGLHDLRRAGVFRKMRPKYGWRLTRHSRRDRG
jgi:hypothetical protein